MRLQLKEEEIGLLDALLASKEESSQLIPNFKNLLFKLFIVLIASFTLYYSLSLLTPIKFQNPLIPISSNVEPLVPPFTARLTQHTTNRISTIQAELDSRFQALGLDISPLPCSRLNQDRFSSLKYSHTSHDNAGPYFIALNLSGSQSVIPSISRALLELSDYLGVESIHVSIFENGSLDNTVMALAHLAAALTQAGIEHTIISSPETTQWASVDRIEQLSIFRNLAIAPMEEGIRILSNGNASNIDFRTLIFINDVYFCPSDLLNLILNKRVENANAACGLDFRSSATGGVKFYDTWVSRTIKGEVLRSRFDLFSEFRNGLDELFTSAVDKESKRSWDNRSAIPVYSCWNGMVVLDAQPFLKEGIRFRNGGIDECAASECKILAKDFWSLGYTRWLIIPTVRVTYEEDVYSHPNLVELASSSEGEQAGMIDWNSISPPESVVCYAYDPVFHLDLPYRKTYWPAT